MAGSAVCTLLLQKARDKNQEKALRAAFRKADTNGDGRLSYQEYWNIIRGKISITEEEFQEIMNIKDVNKDG